MCATVQRSVRRSALVRRSLTAAVCYVHELKEEIWTGAKPLKTVVLIVVFLPPVGVIPTDT